MVVFNMHAFNMHAFNMPACNWTVLGQIGATINVTWQWNGNGNSSPGSALYTCCQINKYILFFGSLS